jgi:hypothetical protein
VLRWHVEVRGYIPCLLSWPEACMWGYPIHKVPIVVLGLTSGEAVNPQVGSISFSSRGFSETQCLLLV